MVDDYLKGAGSRGYLECYCRADTIHTADDVFVVNGKNERLCAKWLTEKSLSIGLPFAIVVAIIFINTVMLNIFKMLARFEKHRSITKELSSRVLKVFIGQFLNTGLLILVINAKFTNKSPVSFLTGEFDDMSPEWYQSVGATLVRATLLILNLTY